MSIVRFSALALIISLVGSWSVSYGAEKLTLVLEESKIEFVGKKTDDKHEGGFKKFTAEAVADFEEPSNGTLSIDIETDSLYSDDAKLTNHLKNPDFFDVRKFPHVKFNATKLIPGENGNGKIMGQLEMLGKKVEIEIPVTVDVDEKMIKVDASFVIDRTRWGMNFGEGKILNDVDVKAHLVFLR